MQLVDVTSSAVAGADGYATVRIAGPGDAFDVLDVDAIVCTSDSATLPDVTLYRGDPAGDRRIAYNPDGRSGTFRGGGAADRIGAGDTWSVRWGRCDPGAVCTVTVTGVVTRRGSRR